MELQAIVGKLHIVAGDPRPTGRVPGLIAQPAPKKAHKNRRGDFLFTHLTLHPSADPDPIMPQLTSALGTTFYQTAGPINTALREAIHHINQLLLNWNVSHSGQRREGAITCVVMRGEELFMVQVGPSLALMGHNFGVERLPAEELEEVTPLGQKRHLDFRFTHHRLQPGDMLLLAEPHMMSMATSVLQPALVDTEVEIGLEELQDVVGTESARLLLIEFSDEAPPEFPDGDWEITTLNQTNPPPMLSNPGLPLRVDTAGMERHARRGASAALKGMSTLTAGVADALEQVHPPDGETNDDGRRVARPANQDEEGWAVPAAATIIISLLVAIILTSAFFQRENTRRLGQITQDMQTGLGLAAEETDDGRQRAYYLQVLSLGESAHEIRPQDPQVLSLMTDARQELDRLDNITRLSGMPLHQYDEGGIPTAVALGDISRGEVYVLDSGQSSVWLHLTGNAFTGGDNDFVPRRILSTGQIVQSHTVGRPIDLIWRSRGAAVTRDGIAILDSRGALVTFYPNFEDTRAIQLGLSSAWREPTQMKGFSERVYILDGEAGYIWRYYPVGDELDIREDNQAITFYDTVNLNQVVDFDINPSDGTVLLLYQNGRMDRLADGRSIWNTDTLAEGGLNAPMLAPISLKVVGRGSTASLFALDPGSGRLLQFALSGRLLAQYRATDENGIELLPRAADFAVVENPLRIFVTAEDKLYLLNQP